MKTNVDKYFDGYVKVEEPKANGKGTTTRFHYIDDYYKIRRDARGVKTLKIESTVLTLLYTIVYFYASFMNTDASHTIYVGVFSLLLLIPGLFLYDGVFNLLTSKELIERRKYNYGFVRMQHSVNAMLILSAIQIVGEILFMIVHHADVKSFGMESLFLVLAAIETALLFFFRLELKKVDFEMVPNPLAAEQPGARAAMEADREFRRMQEEERHKRSESNF